MSVDELRSELKSILRKISDLEKLEEDEELGKLFQTGGFDLGDMAATIAMMKMLFTFAKYLDLPFEAIPSLKKEIKR